MIISGSDIRSAKLRMMKYFYPACRDFLGECGSWSGWDGPANTCNMAIGIFCDDEAIYNEALEYYKSGSGGGCLTQMVNPLTFQVNEMGRDTPHAEIGPGSAAELCQMAWNQGDDLFGSSNHQRKFYISAQGFGAFFGTHGELCSCA